VVQRAGAPIDRAGVEALAVELLARAEVLGAPGLGVAVDSDGRLTVTAPRPADADIFATLIDPGRLEVVGASVPTGELPAGIPGDAVPLYEGRDVDPASVRVVREELGLTVTFRIEDAAAAERQAGWTAAHVGDQLLVAIDGRPVMIAFVRQRLAADVALSTASDESDLAWPIAGALTFGPGGYELVAPGS
jgi:hypothetical protein